MIWLSLPQMSPWIHHFIIILNTCYLIHFAIHYGPNIANLCARLLINFHSSAATSSLNPLYGPQFLSTYENMKRWLVANIYHRSRINQKEIKFIGKIRDMPCKLSFVSGLRCN